MSQNSDGLTSRQFEWISGFVGDVVVHDWNTHKIVHICIHCTDWVWRIHEQTCYKILSYSPVFGSKGIVYFIEGPIMSLQLLNFPQEDILFSVIRSLVAKHPWLICKNWRCCLSCSFILKFMFSSKRAKCGVIT